MPRVDSLLFCKATLTCLTAICIFCLGIFEAIFVERYAQYQDACSNVWKLILTASIANITYSVFSVCGMRHVYGYTDDNYGFMLLSELLGLATGIWSIIVHNSITSNCKHFWENHAIELWLFLEIHYYSMMISIMIIMSGILLLLLVRYLKIYANSSMQSSYYNNSIGEEVVSSYESRIDLHKNFDMNERKHEICLDTVVEHSDNQPHDGTL